MQCLNQLQAGGILTTCLSLYSANFKAATCWSYIDNIVTIWTHSEENLKIFFEEINNLYMSIRFTAVWFSVLCLFSITLCLEEGWLVTDLYTQAMDTHE